MSVEDLQYFLLPDGTRVYTGCEVPSPAERAMVADVPVYGENFYLPKEDIKKSLDGDVYKAMRKRRTRWIINQANLGKCFPPGTLIRMADGSQKPIEDVRTLDEVLSAEGNICTVVSTMVRPFEGSLLRICLWGHRHLRCTPEHPILTKTGYKEAKDLSEIDWVAIPKYLPETTSVIDPSSLIVRNDAQYSKRQLQHDKGRAVCGLPGKKKSFQHRVALPEYIVLDRDFGWIMGMFLAEGTASSCRVEFSLHRKEETTLAAKLVKLFLDKFGIELTVVVRNNQCQVKLYGKAWADLFTTLGSRKSHKKQLNSVISSAPREFMEGLLEGWCDGDGLGMQDRNILGGVTVSHALALNMYDIACALGFLPTIETLQPKINPKHKIKSRKMRYIVKYRIEQIGENTPRFLDESKVVWRKVDKICPEFYSGWVHNFETAVDHSYVAESIAVHNCNASATVNAFHNRRDLDGLQHVVLSDCYLYMNINRGRDGGSLLQDGMEFSKQGIAPRVLTSEDQSYTIPHDVYLRRQVPDKWLRLAAVAAKMYTTFECYKLPVNDFQTFKIALASAIARDHQVVHAWHVGNASMRLRNGYLQQGNGPGNHATLFHSGKWVDGEDIVHPDVENSWGPSKDPMYGPTGSAGWGEDGFGLMTMQDAFQCTKYHDFWVFVGNKV